MRPVGRIAGRREHAPAAAKRVVDVARARRTDGRTDARCCPCGSKGVTVGVQEGFRRLVERRRRGDVRWRSRSRRTARAIARKSAGLSLDQVTNDYQWFNAGWPLELRVVKSSEAHCERNDRLGAGRARQFSGRVRLGRAWLDIKTLTARTSVRLRCRLVRNGRADTPDKRGP